MLFVQLADRTLILKQKEFFVFIIATRLLWNHSPSEWFSLYKKPDEQRFVRFFIQDWAIADGHGSSLVMLLRLMTSVEALCSSAEVAGGRTPATPRQINRKLKLMILR